MHHIYEHYIVVSPRDRATWKQVPFHWLVQLMADFKQQNPSCQVALLGFSKGAWWGRYSWPMRQPSSRPLCSAAPTHHHGHRPRTGHRMGHGVAAAAASGSRITVVYSPSDECLARPNLAHEIQISRFGLRFNLVPPHLLFESRAI